MQRGMKSSSTKEEKLQLHDREGPRKMLESVEIGQVDKRRTFRGRVVRSDERQDGPSSRSGLGSTDGKEKGSVPRASQGRKEQQSESKSSGALKGQGSSKHRVTRPGGDSRKDGKGAGQGRDDTERTESTITQVVRKGTDGLPDRNDSRNERRALRTSVAGGNADKQHRVRLGTLPRAVRADKRGCLREIPATGVGQNNQRTRPIKATGTGKEQARQPEKREKLVRTEEGTGIKAATTSQKQQGETASQTRDDGKGSRAKAVEKSKAPPPAPGGELSVIIYNTSLFPEAPNHWSLFCRRYGNMGTISEIIGHRRHYEYNELEDKNPRATQRFRQQVPVASIGDYGRYISCVRDIPVDNMGEQQWNCQNWVMDALEGLYVDDFLGEAEYNEAADSLNGLIDPVGW
jgi:hypothetical protein